MGFGFGIGAHFRYSRAQTCPYVRGRDVECVPSVPVCVYDITICIHYTCVRTCVRASGSREMRIHFESVAALLTQGGRTHSVKINNSSKLQATQCIRVRVCARVCALDTDDNRTQRHLYKICVHKGDGHRVRVSGSPARTHARTAVTAGRTTSRHLRRQLLE